MQQWKASGELKSLEVLLVRYFSVFLIKVVGGHAFSSWGKSPALVL